MLLLERQRCGGLTRLRLAGGDGNHAVAALDPLDVYLHIRVVFLALAAGLPTLTILAFVVYVDNRGVKGVAHLAHAPVRRVDTRSVLFVSTRGAGIGVNNHRAWSVGHGFADFTNKRHHLLG